MGRAARGAPGQGQRAQAVCAARARGRGRGGAGRQRRRGVDSPATRHRDVSGVEVRTATFTFIAVIIISLLLDEAGFFEWAALHVARWGRGSGRRLFALLVLLGAAMAALFANDGAALILTPIVIAMLLALRFSPAATLAFVMAAGFIADTASLPLVVSNLVNIVSADYFDIDFAAYASVMVPVNLVSVAASLGMLMWFFRRDIPGRYEVAELKHPRSAIVDSTTFNAGWAVLALLLAGFFGLGRIGVPISAVAGAGALVRSEESRGGNECVSTCRLWG